MKWLNRILPATLCCCLVTGTGRAQEKAELSLHLGYFNDNGRIQYLVANVKTRVNGKFQPRDSVPVRFFISDDSHPLGKAVTDARGEAVLFLPAAAKPEWDKSPKQCFIAVVDADSAYAAATADLDIAKAKIELDTGSGKTIVATLLEQIPTGWMPVKEVEVILAVKRLGNNLNVSENASYTTDAAGKASTDFKLENLPGDDSGNLMLIARLDANDVYGTISTEKKVPWGIARGSVADFDKRTLYARRGRAPLSLGFIALSLSLAVWSVIVYLVFQIRKIRKIGLHSRPWPK